MDDLPRRHFKAIYADPPWAYKAYSGDTIPARASRNGLATAHYPRGNEVGKFGEAA